MTAVTLNLPERTMKPAQQAAAALQRPLEDVLTDMLTAVLPTTDDAPADMQVELTHMTWLDNQALWDVARSLRRDYGHVTLRKARAYALLSLRGGEPLLNQT